jgi:hypothetical protein
LLERLRALGDRLDQRIGCRRDLADGLCHFIEHRDLFVYRVNLRLQRLKCAPGFILGRDFKGGLEPTSHRPYLLLGGASSTSRRHTTTRS